MIIQLCYNLLYNTKTPTRDKEVHNQLIDGFCFILEFVDSIIMWRELCAETNKEIDYALSFQDTAGCFGIW